MLGFVRRFSRNVQYHSLVAVNGLIRSQSSRSCVGLSRVSEETGLHSTASRELHNICDPGYVPRSCVRNFATAAGAFAEPANDLNSLKSRLAPVLAKLKPKARTAAKKAVSYLQKAEYHPSASLIARLIQDEAAWPSVHDEWKKLADNKAKWDDLLAMYSKRGADKVDAELRAVYGLTPGAAQSLTSLLDAYGNPDPLRGKVTEDDKYAAMMKLIENVSVVCKRYDELLKDTTEELGPFRKVKLPVRGTRIDMRLVAQKEAGPLLTRLLRMVKPGTDSETAAVIGVSGSGKTHTLFEVGFQQMVVYIECVNDLGAPSDTSTMDKNFATMVTKLRALDWSDLRKAREESTRILAIQYLCRLLYLQKMLVLHPDIKPCDFLVSQLSGGQRTIAELVSILSGLRRDDTERMIRLSLKAIRKLTVHSVVVAVDETNVAIDSILPDVFESPKSKAPCSILTPLLQVILESPSAPHLLVSGTGLSLTHGDCSIASDIGKPGMPTLTDFDIVRDREEAWTKLSLLLNLDDCENSAKLELLVGRQRFTTSVVPELQEVFFSHPTWSKQELLEQAIQNSIDACYDRMRARLSMFVQKNELAVTTLSQLALAYSLSEDAVSFPASNPLLEELLNEGICRLTRDGANKFHVRIAEPLAARSVFDVLSDYREKQQRFRDAAGSAADTLPAFEYALDHMLNLYRLHGIKSVEKGVGLELMTQARLTEIGAQQLCVAELPFVKAAVQADKTVMLPDWCTKVRFVATKPVFQAYETKDDDEKFLNSDDVSVLVRPSKHCGPDLVAHLADEHGKRVNSKFVAGFKFGYRPNCQHSSKQETKFTKMEVANSLFVRVMLPSETKSLPVISVAENNVTVTVTNANLKDMFKDQRAIDMLLAMTT